MLQQPRNTRMCFEKQIRIFQRINENADNTVSLDKLLIINKFEGV